MTITRPAIVQFSFAPKALPNRARECGEAHEYLRKVWDATWAFGMTGENAELDLSVEFPPPPPHDRIDFALRAARVGRGTVGCEDEAFCFEFQDVIGVFVELKADSEEAGSEYWRETLARWLKALEEHGVKDLPPGMLGEAYVFRGFLPDAEAVPATVKAGAALDLSGAEPVASYGRALREAGAGPYPSDLSTLLPVAVTDWDESAYYLTKDDFCLWEGSPVRGRRAVAVVAPLWRRGSANTWTVWGGESEFARFASYLLHTSKVTFAQTVFEGAVFDLRARRAEVERALDRVFGGNVGVISKAGEVSPAELERLRAEVMPQKIAKYGLIKGTSGLRDLLRSVQTAQKNIAPLVPQGRAEAAHRDSLFERDARALGWLLEQIPIEIGYMEATQERIEEGYQLLTRWSEEEAKRLSSRLGKLILYQGSILGSLVVALTAIQAFAPLPGVPDPLKWPAVAFLMLLALGLPPLFAHWHDVYNWADKVLGGLMGAGAFTFLSALWCTCLPCRTVSFAAWRLYQLAVAAGGFLAGYLAVELLNRVKLRGQAQASPGGAQAGGG